MFGFGEALVKAFVVFGWVLENQGSLGVSLDDFGVWSEWLPVLEPFVAENVNVN